MKKWLSLLLVLILALSAVPAALAEAGYYTYVLFEIEENGTLYRAYGITGITFRFYEDWSLKSYGLRFEDEEDPAESWKFNDDRTAIFMTVGGTEYTLGLADNIMTLEAGERKLYFRQKSEAEKAAEEPAEQTTIDGGSLADYILKICPVTFDWWHNQAIRYRMDGNADYRFTTDYGPFRYTVSTVTGEILEKEEADIEAARAQEGFREQLTSDEIYEYVFAVCPVQRSAADKISRHFSPDGSWDITLSTVYGDFYYKVDAYTGEILDKDEPDMDAVRAQEGFREPVTSDKALEIAENACPLEPDQITGRKVSQKETGFQVTLRSDSGEFVYTIDRKTGEITDKSEPEVIAPAAAPADPHVLTDAGEGIKLAEDVFPLERDKITSRGINRGSGEIWTVTLGTVYGDFIYLIDPATGEIVEKQEPDIEAARAQEGFREPLSEREIMEIAEKACGLESGEITSRNIKHNSDNTWQITLGTTKGEYIFVIDGFTGEILDSILPGEAAPAAEKDPFEAAIDAAFASIEGFDYKAESIKVAQTTVSGKSAIKVTFTWQGKGYELYYSIDDKNLIDPQ